MMPTGSRTRRTAVLTAQVLVLVLLAVSPRALLAPTAIVHKSKDSKRPKSPKNVVRAEPVRIPGAEKQGQGPAPADTTAQDLNARNWYAAPIESIPRKAFTQLTKPEYLKSYSSALPPIPLAPPA